MPRVAARSGLANKRAGAHDVGVGNQQRRQPADPNCGKRAEWLDRPGHPGERRIDDSGCLGERPNKHDAARPAAGFVALGKVRQCVIAVVKRDMPATGDQRPSNRNGGRHLALGHAPAG
jgi:hypothetical protein